MFPAPDVVHDRLLPLKTLLLYRQTEYSGAVQSVRRRLCFALVGLLIPWILICGFVVLALAEKWRL